MRIIKGGGIKMQCPLCKNGQMEGKKTDYQTKINNEYVIIKNVEANVCDICGEEFLDYNTIKKIEDMIKNNTKPVEQIAISVYDMAG
jgi:YgiT-type zinc finger domain-containing protein